MMLRSPVELLDLEPKHGNILKEVLVGLSKGQKTIHPKFLYDEKGSKIFEEICRVPEYYPTRTENLILKTYGHDMARFIGPRALIIEPGSGSGDKIRLLLPALQRPQGYVPIEISRNMLLRMTDEFSDEFPDLAVYPICADFTQELDLPITLGKRNEKKVIFFPGSTIGNLDPSEAVQFLKSFSRLLDGGGGLLIGVDVKKDRETFELAYDDPGGVTAAFNLNLLQRLNREVDGTFDMTKFKHQAIYNEEKSRVEMHLVSTESQLVRVNQTVFRFKAGETIHTESSYKYSTEEFCELGSRAKFKIMKVWQDPDKLFAVYYFEKQ